MRRQSYLNRLGIIIEHRVEPYETLLQLVLHARAPLPALFCLLRLAHFLQIADLRLDILKPALNNVGSKARIQGFQSLVVVPTRSFELLRFDVQLVQVDGEAIVLGKLLNCRKSI